MRLSLGSAATGTVCQVGREDSHVVSSTISTPDGTMIVHPLGGGPGSLWETE